MVEEVLRPGLLMSIGMCFISFRVNVSVIPSGNLMVMGVSIGIKKMEQIQFFKI
jgi:hypothetical protein